MRTTFILLFLLSSFTLPLVVRSQTEAIINDIQGCNTSWYSYEVRAAVVKKLEKEKDTMNFFHDLELAIYINVEKTKTLEPNTLYIFNHGYNKMFTIDVLSVEFEITAGRRKKDTISPGIILSWRPTGGDSLHRCTYSKLQVLVPDHFKNPKLTAMYVRINYYDKIIYRWFIREKSFRETIPHRVG